MPEYQWQITAPFEGKAVRTAAVYGLGVSSGLFKRAKFHGQILLDGLQVHATARVRTGQILTLMVPDKGEAYTGRQISAELTPLYQDEALLILNKPAPLPTSPSDRQKGETLADRVYAFLGKPEGFVWRPINRLDKGTSGLMAAALDARTQDRMQRMLHTPAFEREYLAVCEGHPPKEEGLIDLPISKEDAASVKRVIDPNGKEARTHYRVIATNGKRSLLRLKLDTGRTHQIRVHLAAIGCPVCGDFLYGTELPELPGRFALHSCRIGFVHPSSGESISIECPLPEELLALMNE